MSEPPRDKPRDLGFAPVSIGRRMFLIARSKGSSLIFDTNQNAALVQALESWSN